MARTFVPPTTAEGFDRVTYWNIYGELQGIDYNGYNNNE
jgi:hypothetical protein